jgi:hypothetical protein
MKNLRTIALCVSISLYSLCANAQNGTVPINEPDLNKPKLFNGLPEIIRLQNGAVTSLFAKTVGTPIDAEMAETNNFRIQGQIVSAVSKYDNKIQSVVIRSSNYAGAVMTFSKLTAENGKVSYTGRMVSMQHGDLYELKIINEQFVFVKKNFYELVNE